MYIENYLLYELIAVILITIFFVWKKIRKPKGDTSAWKGEVKRKDSQPDNSYSVTVITDDNQTITTKVSKILWSNLERGDRIEKRKEDLFPRKV